MLLIPPSALAVVHATIAQISIGALLMALILPGLLLASSYVLYIIIRCSLTPSLAPRDESLVRVSKKQALKELLIYVAPLSLIKEPIANGEIFPRSRLRIRLCQERHRIPRHQGEGTRGLMVRSRG